MSIINRQRNDIQGLRAFAVLAVIIFHVNHDWLPGGFIGVDIFFVISGYLITGIVLAQKEKGTYSFLSFYSSRVRRIAPAYFFLLAGTAMVMAALLTPRDFDSFHDSLKSAAYFNSNNYFSRQSDYFAPLAHELPLLHTWSLAIEMQFYLFLPALILLIPKRYIKAVLVLLVLGLFGYSAFLLQQGERQGVYFSLLARFPEFLIGSLLATWREADNSRNNANIRAGVGLALLLLGLVFISEASPFPGLLALLPCVGTALLIRARGSVVNRWLSGKAMVFIGGLSYSLYLWHWPVLAGFRYFYERYELPLLALMASAMLIVVLSLISYYFVEQPLRRASGRRGAVKLASCFIVVVACALSAKAMNPMMVAPLPVELTRYAQLETICHGQIVGECLRGDPQGSTEILLLGDSHAAQLNNFADVVGKSIHARIRVITASSCVPIAGFDEERISEWARKPCANQIQQVQKYLTSADAVILAGMWQYHVSSEKFISALEQFLGNAALREQPLIVLAQVPMLTSNVQRMYRFNALGASRAALLEKTWAPANAKIQALVSNHQNQVFFEPTKLALFASPPFANGQLIYQDDHHLNEVGSNAYGVAAADLLGKELNHLQQVVQEQKLARAQQ